jgi:hypothetical protein
MEVHVEFWTLNFEPPQRFERSEAIEPFDRTQGKLLERLERLERHSFENRGASIRESKVREEKKGIRKILTGTSVPLDSCLLMGDPKHASSSQCARRLPQSLWRL